MALNVKKVALAAALGLGVAGCSGVQITIGNPDSSDATAPVQQEKRVQVFNRTGDTILKLFSSSQGSDVWREATLEGGSYSNGTSKLINFEDGTSDCVYDIRANFSEGRSYIRRNVNLCSVDLVSLSR